MAWLQQRYILSSSLIFSFLSFFFTQFSFKHSLDATEIYTFFFSLDFSFLSSNTGCILSMQTVPSSPLSLLHLFPPFITSFHFFIVALPSSPPFTSSSLPSLHHLLSLLHLFPPFITSFHLFIFAGILLFLNVLLENIILCAIHSICNAALFKALNDDGWVNSLPGFFDPPSNDHYVHFLATVQFPNPTHCNRDVHFLPLFGFLLSFLLLLYTIQLITEVYTFFSGFPFSFFTQFNL
ncbi:unnamed protein product [Acanthosepion pharaonis]|uniref:Transmembrane protein n=1 Tax=Acanthosepion pharaonis TaxID=158019 RepID=A0A812CZX5_ACAPH|nr:unnamed protein product [Sepia pharaonis]